MSNALLEPELSPAATDAPAATDSHHTETLAQGVLLMLGLVVAQRAVGFVRTVLFCRWMDPIALGEWDMALAFLSLAAPLAVLGVPGSFGRYVEQYRLNRRARSFIRRATTFTGFMVALCACLCTLRPDWLSWAIFGRADRLDLALMLVAGFVAVVALNFLNDLLNGLRRLRAASLAQLVQGLGFAVIGVVLAWCWQPTALAVISAYGAATLLAAMVGTVAVAKAWPGLSDDGQRFSHRAILCPIAKFAAWMWLANALTNLFTYVDRYVMLHCCGLDEVGAMTLIGNYHTARILPLLISSVAITVAGAMLPHLSHDWECGRVERVSRRSALSLKLLSLGLTLAGLAVLLAAPLLFNVALHGKFNAGRDVLAWTLVCGVWAGLHTSAFNYLWCAERSRLVSVAIFAGLLLNIGLNLVLVPRFGLAGAVWGTCLASLAVLLLAVWFSSKAGLPADKRLLAMLAVPLLLCLPTWGAAAALFAVTGLCWRTNWLLSADEQQQLGYVVEAFWNKLARIRAALE